MFDLDASEKGRQALFEQQHAVHKALGARWQLLLDAVEGEGGFDDGGYLTRFPRELESAFAARKENARYHNYAAALVGLYVRKVMQAVTRTTASADLQAWWADVDRAGTPIGDFLSRALTQALAAGHTGILVDKTREAPTGPARADERARVVLARYLPGDICDWRLRPDAGLVSVLLAEEVPVGNLLTPPPDADAATRRLLWDADEWVRVEPGAEGGIERAPHGLGTVPFVVLRPIPSTRWPLVGASLLGNGSLLRALYNRQSEEDDVLRNQAFSVFVITLDKDADVKKAKDELGTEVGTTRALFVAGGTGNYETPDQGVATAIRENQQHLIRELYRMCHVPFDRDSAAAESAESKQADFEELKGVLKGIGHEMARVETALVRHWCAWQSATPAAAEALFEQAQVQIAYSDEFFENLKLDDLELDLQALQLDAGPTFEQQIRKDAVRRLKPHLDEQTLAKIDTEIEQGTGRPAAPDPEALRRTAVGQMRALLTAGESDDLPPGETETEAVA